MGRRARRLGDERGVATIEAMGMLPYLVLAALASLQLLLAAASVAAVEGAARTGGRVAAAGGDGAAAALQALPSFLSAGDADGSQTGGTVRLTVRAPLVLPGIDTGALTITRSASFPVTERRGS